jgi:transcription-repair coupling factor (superfamily II helicase)
MVVDCACARSGATRLDGSFETAAVNANRQFVRELARTKALSGLLQHFARSRTACSLQETIPAARPALLAAVQDARKGQTLVVMPTPDAAERAFADLLYYLGETEADTIALLGSREESIGTIGSPTERSARITLFADLLDRKPRIVLAGVAALRQYTIPPRIFSALRVRLRVGDEPGWDQLQQRLYRLGYRRSDVVSAAGEFAVRGGILDVYAATEESPVRVEFFGDQIEAIRAFDIESQLSSTDRDSIDISPWSEVPRDEIYRERVTRHAPLEPMTEIPEAWLSFAHDERATILDYLRDDALVVLDEPALLADIERALDEERAREAELAEVAPPAPSLADLRDGFARRSALVLPGAIEIAHPPAWLPRIAETFVLETHPVEHFNRQIEMFSQSAREWTAAGERLIIVTTAVSRMNDILSLAGVSATVDHGSIESGFAIPSLRLRVLGDREIFGQPPRRVKLRAVKEGVPVTLADLKIGDYVVHAVHGIGQYLGLRAETILGATQDYLDLQYAGSDRMLVPVTQMHQVTKYSAGDGATPRLSKMGGADWVRTKSRVSESLAKIADGLVALYAEREMARGHAFGADTTWQSEVEEAFPYDPTPDQAKAIAATKSDMESERPMDRLVCGDVGYGKTEVAIRAAFKAVADKKQVAILVPTTLLADQHYRTFSTRFAGFPMRVEGISRFKTKAEQRVILADLAAGKVDIVIGTHRLLQKDVAFADLGLIVIDEEQRFGVMHKERLKEYRTSVDVLTLSATPIPRTLHMSLMGVRDLSLIQTAPKNRMSIKTVVVPESDALIHRAVTAELDRGGQVYYLHNRVESIYAVKNALQKLLPTARIGIGHGQMTESQLEPVMRAFIEGDLDVLVATTIIENGIDIPNVNTMIVHDSDKFGLAQLYQLRGRVGRSNHQAYCYLLYQAHKALGEDAKARLEAIREFTHLGSGLQIAMRDLEIRGAGNLLGAAQSGFIGTVGFDTYCQLLAEAIAERRGMGKALEEQREAVIDVKIDAFVPTDYVPQVSQKIAIYQQLAKARRIEDVEEIAAGVRDRFGPFPRPLANLVELTKLRAIALHKHVTRVVVDEKRLTLGVGTGFALGPEAIPKFQSLTRNRFRFAEGKILVDLPPLGAGERAEDSWMPLLEKLLTSM